MKIITEFDQLSEEWEQARLGSIGGSSIGTVVSSGTGRTTLLYRFAGEILSGQKYESYSNDFMRRGIQLEPEARSYYAMLNDKYVWQVAMVKSDEPYKHESPDGLVGDDGKIEIKCVIPSTHVETIIKGKIPSQYRRQVQWGLHICEREWCDFISYCPEIVDKPIYIIRAKRDEKLIKELDEGANKFIKEMLDIVKKVKGA